MKTLENKWALVTGASRGVGRQIAIGLAERKCNLILHARSKSNLTATENLIKKYGVNFISVEAELSDEKQVDGMISEIKEKIGTVEILYNNAAIMSKYNEDFFRIDIDEYKKIFEVNVWTVIRLCSAFAPMMRKNKWGRIINVTSGIENQPQLAPYSISKAAIDKYTKDIAGELKKDNVLANLLDPGWLKTDMGGKDAWFEVETVLPGALVPALLDDYSTAGELFRAQDYKMLER
ncbi:SDR family NAD(P)-dependent oxidoreductase [Melioribacter sp. Ez-97]|uniref:SDR family NAD(P)-dependent oxidoreductase n=1 Tax=Melioribacter sp. Ez-97 TaxID=3423434 RepID=UPI003ED8C286